MACFRIGAVAKDARKGERRQKPISGEDWRAASAAPLASSATAADGLPRASTPAPVPSSSKEIGSPFCT